MELKTYQIKALERLRSYLEHLREAETKRDQVASLGLGIPYEWDKDAWKKSGLTSSYHSRTNGLGDSVPTVCLKIPTGGGKTLLAVKALDSLTNYYGQRSKLILWIVPSSQIYNQTLTALRDRNHPYRQELDLTSGNKTLILEKNTPFKPVDVENHLTVMLLMLPSANRETKESLRIFRDQGGFTGFFPDEDNYTDQSSLIKQIPNLDCYGENGFGQVIKTSLGNTLRLLNPIIVLDEGHKAYSELAQRTLLGFNPVFMLELSATPPANANILVNITGQQLLQEGMIKLDLHLQSRSESKDLHDKKRGINWRDVVKDGHEQRINLENMARLYEANTGVYIRPINLIQVERTGKDQRDSGFTHAEDVREHLIKDCNVQPNEIAIKSSQKDEIENIDLLSRDCQIRYIITKQALQEGWDCPFAYILTVLTNPHAKTGLTQLVGRILRQPYARKTGEAALDESYVYCGSNDANKLLTEVLAGLKHEGMGDLLNRVVQASGTNPMSGAIEKQDAVIRDNFKEWAGKVFLPCFVVPNESGGWREIQYEMDILSKIDWKKVNLDRFNSFQLNPIQSTYTYQRVSLDPTAGAIETIYTDDQELDLVFLTKQLLDYVGNPWVAYEFIVDILNRLRNQDYTEDEIKRDQGFIMAELRKQIIRERKRLAKEVFLDLVNRQILRFFLVSGAAGSVLPERISVRGRERLNRTNGTPLQQNMFDPVMKEDFNELERSVALYLDQQYWVLSWYRNLVHSGYSIQGWGEHRIFSDFIAHGHDAPEGSSTKNKLDTVYVLETKGIHLQNEDTTYKQEVFELANRMSEPKLWNDIEGQFSNHRVHFQVIFEDEWERILNELFHSRALAK